MPVIELKAWEVHVFSWGSALKHRKGPWAKLFLYPTGQEIDVSKIPVLIDDTGITFLGGVMNG